MSRMQIRVFAETPETCAPPTSSASWRGFGSVRPCTRSGRAAGPCSGQWANAIVLAHVLPIVCGRLDAIVGRPSTT
jgi:hypothetical protein